MSNTTNDNISYNCFHKNVTFFSNINLTEVPRFYDYIQKTLKAALLQLVVPDSRGHNDSFSRGEGSRYVSLAVRNWAIDLNKIGKI